MALTILNNISSLSAENALSNTQANLQKTLTQLSTGLKINSGSDDAAGLSIANGMQANIAALTQSQQNASNAIGFLQTADGALSQVTMLLNRAVTLATEAANSNVTNAVGTPSQAAAIQKEFTSIANEIDQIGTNTNFNGQNVFSTAGQTVATVAVAGGGSVAATLAQAETAGKTTIVSTNGGANLYTYKAVAGDTVQQVVDAINANVTGVTASVDAATFKITYSSSDKTLDVTAGTDTLTTAAAAVTGLTTPVASTAFISDGSSALNTSINTPMTKVDSTTLGLVGAVLTTTAGAALALTALVGASGAINQVASSRGAIGASVNRLTAANSVMSNEVTNLTSGVNSISNADIGKTVANMTQYNVLQSTGMAALQQSNQAQQAVLKLVQ